jgi:EAL domain-containing protein (putative c-di-GMP-specific phosphodiesterase class I)
MAQALQLGVVAEGVETAEQAAEAHALGCGSAQGYYFARPAPANEIESLIRAANLAT